MTVRMGAMIKLLKHQESVLKQTADLSHVGYFLDMGTGKTFVGAEKIMRLGYRVNLIVCQKSKVDDWCEHFDLYSDTYHNHNVIYDLTEKHGFEAFIDVAADPTTQHMVIGVINYDLIFRRKQLQGLENFTLMLDESQCIQNESAKRSRFILKMRPANVILLSGTPTSGKYERLWSQCRLLGWNISKEAYWNTYIETEWREDTASGFKRPYVMGYKNVPRLKRKLAEHGAIFMKLSDIGVDLPEQTDITIRIPASVEYRKFVKNGYVIINGVERAGDTVLTKFLYARQLCGQFSKEKIEAVRDLIESTDERIVVFYNFYAELELLKKIAEENERPVSQINGSMHDLEAYENEDNAVTFVQYQAGAMGLNLQKAHITIFFTLPFGRGSCATWEQAKKRTHRIGQKSKCLYYYPLVTGSIEEKNLLNLKLGIEYNEQLFAKEIGNEI